MQYLQGLLPINFTEERGRGLLKCIIYSPYSVAGMPKALQSCDRPNPSCAQIVSRQFIQGVRFLGRHQNLVRNCAMIDKIASLPTDFRQISALHRRAGSFRQELCNRKSGSGKKAQDFLSA